MLSSWRSHWRYIFVPYTATLAKLAPCLVKSSRTFVSTAMESQFCPALPILPRHCAKCHISVRLTIALTIPSQTLYSSCLPSNSSKRHSVNTHYYLYITFFFLAAKHCSNTLTNKRSYTLWSDLSDTSSPHTSFPCPNLSWSGMIHLYYLCF